MAFDFALTRQTNSILPEPFVLPAAVADMQAALAAQTGRLSHVTIPCELQLTFPE